MVKSKVYKRTLFIVSNEDQFLEVLSEVAQEWEVIAYLDLTCFVHNDGIDGCNTKDS